MDSGVNFFIRRHDKVHGPFDREHLRELATGGHIDGATEVALSVDGPWSALSTQIALRGILAQDAPPAFDRANTTSQPPIDLADVIAAAHRRPPGAAAAISAAPAALPPPVSAPHDVKSLLQFNLAIEKKRGVNQPVPPRERRSRRRRDYFEILALLGLVIFTILLVESYAAVQIQVLAAHMQDQFWPVLKAVIFHSPIFAWGLAMYAVIAVALAWLMFGLMDDY